MFLQNPHESLTAGDNSYAPSPCVYNGEVHSEQQIKITSIICLEDVHKVIEKPK